MILSTDLAVHKQYMTKYKELTSSIPSANLPFNEIMFPKDDETQLLILTCVIKSADIGHPCKLLVTYFLILGCSRKVVNFSE